MTSSSLYEYYAVLPHYSEPLLLLLQGQLRIERGWNIEQFTVYSANGSAQIATESPVPST